MEQVERAGQLHLRVVSRASVFKLRVKSWAGSLKLFIYDYVLRTERVSVVIIIYCSSW